MAIPFISLTENIQFIRYNHLQTYNQICLYLIQKMKLRGIDLILPIDLKIGSTSIDNTTRETALYEYEDDAVDKGEKYNGKIYYYDVKHKKLQTEKEALLAAATATVTPLPPLVPLDSTTTAVAGTVEPVLISPKGGKTPQKPVLSSPTLANKNSSPRKQTTTTGIDSKSTTNDVSTTTTPSTTTDANHNVDISQPGLLHDHTNNTNNNSSTIDTTITSLTNDKIVYEYIYDIGHQSIKVLESLISQETVSDTSHTQGELSDTQPISDTRHICIIWGPTGVVESSSFQNGTRSLIQAIQQKQHKIMSSITVSSSSTTHSNSTTADVALSSNINVTQGTFISWLIGNSVNEWSNRFLNPNISEDNIDSVSVPTTTTTTTTTTAATSIHQVNSTIETHNKISKKLFTHDIFSNVSINSNVFQQITSHSLPVKEVLKNFASNNTVTTSTLREPIKSEWNYMYSHFEIPPLEEAVE